MSGVNTEVITNIAPVKGVVPLLNPKPIYTVFAPCGLGKSQKFKEALAESVETLPRVLIAVSTVKLAMQTAHDLKELGVEAVVTAGDGDAVRRTQDALVSEAAVIICSHATLNIFEESRLLNDVCLAIDEAPAVLATLQADTEEAGLLDLLPCVDPNSNVGVLADIPDINQLDDSECTDEINRLTSIDDHISGRSQTYSDKLVSMIKGLKERTHIVVRVSSGEKWVYTAVEKPDVLIRNIQEAGSCYLLSSDIKGGQLSLVLNAFGVPTQKAPESLQPRLSEVRSGKVNVHYLQKKPMTKTDMLRDSITGERQESGKYFGNDSQYIDQLSAEAARITNCTYGEVRWCRGEKVIWVTNEKLKKGGQVYGVSDSEVNLLTTVNNGINDYKEATQAVYIATHNPSPKVKPVFTVAAQHLGVTYKEYEDAYKTTANLERCWQSVMRTNARDYQSDKAVTLVVPDLIHAEYIQEQLDGYAVVELISVGMAPPEYESKATTRKLQRHSVLFPLFEEGLKPKQIQEKLIQLGFDITTKTIGRDKKEWNDSRKWSLDKVA